MLSFVYVVSCCLAWFFWFPCTWLFPRSVMRASKELFSHTFQLCYSTGYLFNNSAKGWNAATEVFQLFWITRQMFQVLNPEMEHWKTYVSNIYIVFHNCIQRMNGCQVLLLLCFFRKQKRHLWNRAVELVSTSESRVREELQLIDGDKQEFVWRYLDVSNTPYKKL